MSESALDRTARALDLIPFISENPGLSIEELAAEFHTTPKAITKDLELLFVCGLPGYSPLELIDLAFDSGYVSVTDPQSLDRPRKMSHRELLALILGLDVLLGLHVEFAPEITRLREKLVSVLKQAELPIQIEQISDSGVAFIDQIEEVIASRKLLQLDYQGGTKDQLTRRVIRPDQLSHLNGLVYLSGWCFLSRGYRTFRTDRIVILSVIEPDETKYHADDTSQQPDLISEVTLEVTPSAKSFFEENSGIIDSVEVTDSVARVRIQVNDPEWLLRTCLGLGAKVRILAPESLKSALRERAQSTLDLYRSTNS